jgi:hypothetical protein
MGREDSPAETFCSVARLAGTTGRQGQNAMTTFTPQNRRKTGNPTPGGEATRWKPGQSGNPGGRPKTAPLSHACCEVLAQPVRDDPEGRTYAQKIAAILAEKAAGGDIRAAQELADRAEGKPRQSIEVEHTKLREAFDRMSREELEAYARDGALPEWFPKDETIQ